MRNPTASRYTGYYTAKVVWHQERCWGDLVFGSGRSWLGSGAEGGAFRKNHKIYVTVDGGTSRTAVKNEGTPPYDGHDVPGHVSFIPAERQNRGWYEGTFLDTVSLEILPKVFAKCLDGHDPSAVEFFPTTNSFDPLIFQIMGALQEELQTGLYGGRLFAETSATLIALHLLRNYSGLGRNFARNARSPLARSNLKLILEFIEENIGNELSLDTLATVAAMPVSTFTRTFASALKMPPHKFVMLRRIERARQLLSSSQLTIVEIALMLGFSSQAHFSNVFRSIVGESPARFRQSLRLTQPLPPCKNL